MPERTNHVLCSFYWKSGVFIDAKWMVEPMDELITRQLHDRELTMVTLTLEARVTPQELPHLIDVQFRLTPPEPGHITARYDEV